MGRVLVVQRRGVGEPHEYLEAELLLPEGRVVVVQGVPEMGPGLERQSERLRAIFP